VFENRVLRRILGSESDEVGGGWRRRQVLELNYLYRSTKFFFYKNEKNEMGRACRSYRRE